MRKIGWLFLTVIFATASAVLAAWQDMGELRQGRIWNLAKTDSAEGRLHNARVFIDEARAMILPGLEDRALIYLRVGIEGAPDALENWRGCDLALTDSEGRKWRPLQNRAGIEIVDMLGDDSEVDSSCSQSLILTPSEVRPTLSAQAFLVPIGVLNDLRLELAGLSTRPDGLSLPFRPVLRPPLP